MTPERPETEVLETFRLVKTLDLFAIGVFDSAVTVLSQQARALNLAWALGQSGRLSQADRPRIAVVGGGFAGLSFVAGLVGKSIAADVTILERRDSILPLQQGSDSRWLHPHIYDWPAVGSQASSAGLPVLNWTAARASDVAVQVEASWRTLLRRSSGEGTNVELYCNTTRTRVDVLDSKLAIEWIGHRRRPDEPATSTGEDAQAGRHESFDIVVLATGFGSEVDGTTSYWRNETLGQPALDATRREFVVSGYGDGGLIDLFRLRVMNFRQDRILGELFHGMRDFVTDLQALQSSADKGASAIPALMRLWESRPNEAEEVDRRLRSRLRHDTSVILQMRENHGIAGMFDGRRVSYQNQLLAWMLFVVGAFDIRVGDLRSIVDSERIGEGAIVRRHGPLPFDTLTESLGGSLRNLVVDDEGKPIDKSLRSRCQQSDRSHWSGGYFDRPLADVPDRAKAHWKQEYLPASTRIIAGALCGAIATHLENDHPADRRLRITFHRTISIGDSPFLQQCCEYQGIDPGLEQGTAARTFPHRNGLIGRAFLSRRIVRTAPSSSNSDIQKAMDEYQLHDSSRAMSNNVNSMLAIPCLELGTDRVVGIAYLDSFQGGFFQVDARVGSIVRIVQGFLDGIATEMPNADGGSVSNVPYWREVAMPPVDAVLDDTLEFVDLGPPSVPVARINLDVASFVEAGG